jgi:lysophospholipase L1-like esterase
MASSLPPVNLRPIVATLAASMSISAGWANQLPLNTSDIPSSITVTATTSGLGPSGITNAQFFPSVSSYVLQTANFSYPACAVGVASTTYPAYLGVHGINKTDTTDVGLVIAEFMIYDSQFELPWLGQSGNLRVLNGNNVILQAGQSYGTGTSQGGTTTSITLASTASATNGVFNKQWIYITGGTGAGQYAQVTGYVGSTKVATVAPSTGSWTVAPDTTSTYDIRIAPAPFSMPGTTGLTYNVLFTFPTVAARRIRVECSGGDFFGIRVGPVGSVFPVKKVATTLAFVAGDSFSDGTGAFFGTTGLGFQTASQLGCEPWLCTSGGTGYLNGSIGDRLTICDRLAPPPNSWRLYLGGATGGTFTLTWNGQTTAPIAYNASAVVIQEAIAALTGIGATFTGSTTGSSTTLTVSAVASGTLAAGQNIASSSVSQCWIVEQLTGTPGGIGTYQLSEGVGTITNQAMTASNAVVGNTVLVANGSAFTVLFRNALANSPLPLTITSSLTGTVFTPTVTQYIGDLAPYVPVDGNGNPQPFLIILLGGHNDSADTNPNFTASLLQSTVTALLQKLVPRYPTATILMSGVLYLPNNASPNTIAANAALKAAAQAALPTINGVLPFVDTLTVPWASGTGNIGAPTGSGNSDVFCWNDGVHPFQDGHNWYAQRLAQNFQSFLAA